MLKNILGLFSKGNFIKKINFNSPCNTWCKSPMLKNLYLTSITSSPFFQLQGHNSSV